MSAPLAARVGIFQGRLVESTTGELQCSPGARWREEVTIAGELGFSHVELLAERRPDPTAPIWSTEGRAELRFALAAAGLAPVSLCSEEPIEVALDSVAQGEALGARLAPVAADLHLGVVVLAMDGASDLRSVDVDGAAGAVAAAAAALAPHGSAVAVELTIPAGDSAAFLDRVGSPSVGVCYDVGNATAAGFDPAEEIAQLGARVVHVHAKDKDARGTNVRFGTGNVDFRAAFAALARLDYDGAVTIEATRGDDPVGTAAEHRAFLLALDERERR